MPYSSAEQQVVDILNQLGISFTRREHPPVYTVEQAQLYDQDTPGAHCKNLFLRNKKGSRYYLAILEDSTALGLRELAGQVGEAGLGFASPERLLRCLAVEPGAVGPFGLINDAEKSVQVVLENRLKEAAQVSFHPNINTVTITISVPDFEKFLTWCGNPVMFI